MRADAGIILIICLLLLVGTVGAIDTLDISTSKDWVIANGVDQSTITMNVKNTTGPINGATVSFIVNDPVYGTMSPATVTTGPSGVATSSFNVNKKSGTATITATINYNDGEPVTIVKTVSQNIDHDVLMTTFTPTTGTVGTEVPFLVSIKDPSGNPIDNRRSDDTISLSVSCPMPNDCEFVGYGHSYSSQPDSHGNLTIPLKLGTKTGVTTIVMNPVQSLSQQMAFIDTVPSDTLYLTADISPAAVPPSSIPTVPVGTGVFSFIYTLSDKFGNPVANKPIQIQTSLSETQLTKTNALGQTPVQTYGPKGSASTVVITATVVNTPSITNQFTVSFVNVQPTMTLSVSPLSMASLDYGGTSANVVVLVRNDLGNAISGEDITITLDSCTVSGDVTNCPSLNPQTSATPLKSYSGKTDSNGMVITKFIPGTFKSGTSLDRSTILTATWTSNPSYLPKTATITWSNKPYLNIETSVSSQTVKVNDTIDVTIKVAVEGKIPPPGGPYTIMLDQDCSANMGGGAARLSQATAAETLFINKLDPSRTQIGLQTLGNPDYDPGPYRHPTEDYLALITDLGNLKKGKSSSDMNNSIIKSLTEINTYAVGTHAKDLKAFIILTDGNSNLNDATINTIKQMIIDSNIVPFTISYNNNCGGGQSPAQLLEIAQAGNGKYFCYSDASSLNLAFDEIAQKLADLAGKNTNMTVSFANIKINQNYMDGKDVYDYIPVNIPGGLSAGPPGAYSSPSSVIDSNARTSIIWPDGTQSIKNQSLEWTNLKFDIGAISLGKYWLTTFRLKVKQPGCYNVFGSGSKIELGSGSSITLPDLPICVNITVKEKGLLNGTLEVSNLQTVPPGVSFTDFIPLQWNTKYNSTTPGNSATEYVSYRINGGPWNQFGAMPPVPSKDLSQTTPLSKTLDIRNLPSGSYDIWVHATAVDANDADTQITFSILGSGSRNAHIKLQ